MAAAGRERKAKAGGAKEAEAPRFRSAEELREVLDALFRALDSDPEAAARLRSARIPHRLRFPDLGVVCDLRPAEDPERCVEWSFGESGGPEPALTLELDSAHANRYLQGQLNLVIAIARRQVKFNATDPRAALSFLPLGDSLTRCYRRLVDERYPHLALDERFRGAGSVKPDDPA
jgi:hypothetical protein